MHNYLFQARMYLDRPENRPKLVHIESDDELNDDQINVLMKGRSLYEDSAFHMRVIRSEEYEAERIYNEDLREHLAGAMTDFDEDCYEELHDQMIELIYERNTSDPERELLENTSGTLFVVPLGKPWPHGPITLWNANLETENMAAQWIAEQLYGVKRFWDLSDDELEVVWNFIENCPYGFHEESRLEIMFYAKPADLMPACNSFIDPLQVTPVLFFKDPVVILLDTINGAGFEQKLDGCMQVVRKHRPVVEDSRHYSWTETAGIHPSYYQENTAKILTWETDERYIQSLITNEYIYS